MKLLDKLYQWRSKFLKPKNTVATVVTQHDDAFYLNLLETIKNEKRAVNIQFIHNADEYISMILDIQFEKKLIILDELNAPSGHKLALNQIPFVLSTKHQGISLCFASRVIEAKAVNGIYYYCIQYPQRIDYLQRRLVPRVAIPETMSFYVDFTVPGFGPLRAKVEDFSTCGLQFSIARNVRNVFGKLDKIENLRLQSPFLPPSSFRFEIKHFRFDAIKQRTFVGGQFVSLDNVGLKYLSTLSLKLK